VDFRCFLARSSPKRKVPVVSDAEKNSQSTTNIADHNAGFGFEIVDQVCQEYPVLGPDPTQKFKVKIVRKCFFVGKMYRSGRFRTWKKLTWYKW
jgi:hypothetical protein